MLIALSSLSAKAQKAYQATVGNDEGRDIVEAKTTQAADTPWYADIDLNWYIENHKQQYYQAVELAKHIREFLDYTGTARTDFAIALALKLGIGLKTLYRHTERYLEASAWAMRFNSQTDKNYDFFRVLALCRKVKPKHTFPSLSPEARVMIENIWFHKDFAANHGTVKMLFDRLQQIAAEKDWQLPSYQTVARYINYLIKIKRASNAHFLAAQGVREYKNKIMLKGTRNTNAIPVMGLVQGDVHTFDCWVQYTHPNGQVTAIRPNLVAWVDLRSRYIVSDLMCLQANAQIMKQSFWKMMYNEVDGVAFGVPHGIYIDNGKEYTAHSLLGRPRKERVQVGDSTKGYCRSIGIIDDTRSLPHQPWGKGPIERFFGTVINGFTRWQKSYTGTLTGSETIGKVKKDIQKMLEQGKLLTLNEFYELWERWLHEVYHQRPHAGLKKQKEKWLTPLELFINAEERYFKAPPPKSTATVLMMKQARVHVYNTSIRKFGQEYRSQELALHIGEKVNVRWNPEDMSHLYAYTLGDEWIGEVASQELLAYTGSLASEAELKRLQKHAGMQKKQLKADRERVDWYNTPYEQRQAGITKASGIAGLMKENATPNPKVVAMPECKEPKRPSSTNRNSFFEKQAEKALKALEQLEELG